jgi:hypothetical protein
VIDLSHETPISLNDAAKLIPPARRGKRTHLSTILRWILTGAEAPDGTAVRLEGIRLGSRWMTSREAIQRFAERLTPQCADTPAALPPRTSTARRKAGEQAGRDLEQLGV